LHLLSALAKRTASNSGLGVSSAKSAGTLHIQALSLPQLGFNCIDWLTKYKIIPYKLKLKKSKNELTKKKEYYCSGSHKFSMFYLKKKT